MKIPWANPWLDKSEKDEILKTVDSAWLSMGPRTKMFEDKMRIYTGVKHAVAVSNGTDALDLALKAIGVGPDDEVIAPAMTYVATVSSILYQNATPVFADIEPETYNIDPTSVKKLITKRTKCIVYIDYGGNPADYIGLMLISKRFGIPLLHDAAQSLGGTFNDNELCGLGLVSTTSFHIAKLITTIEGGMVFTGDRRIADRVRMTRNQGEDPEKKYIHRVLGTNARMTDMQAAIGLRQLEKLDAIVKRRRAIAARYYRAFKEEDRITLPIVRKGGESACFFAPILVENRQGIEKQLNKVGISTRVAYPMPVYEQPFFKRYMKRGKRYDCPCAKWMTERVLNLPMFHAMTDEQLSYVSENVMRIVHSDGK